MTDTNKPSSEMESGKVLDLPIGWEGSRDEFKARVTELIQQYGACSYTQPIKCNIKNPDGSVTPFYPLRFAIENDVMSILDAYSILYHLLEKKARDAYEKATQADANLTWDTWNLAWGLNEWLFTQDQIKKIRFTDGDTEESYIARFRVPHLIESYINVLIWGGIRVAKVVGEVKNNVRLQCDGDS